MRADGATALFGGTRYKPLLIWSHGRSGSTLFLDMLASDPALWSIYEPLQDVRQRPPSHFQVAPSQVGPCRDHAKGADTLRSACPLRDAGLLLAALDCDFAPLLTAWYAELELTNRFSAFLPHGNVHGAGYTTTTYYPDLRERRATMMREQQRSCSAKLGSVGKVIRMNGHLDAVHEVALALGRPLPLVIHLVRDPRAMYASRKRLSREAFGVPRAQSKALLHSWARDVCSTTQQDAALARAKMRGSYMLVDYSDFVRRPKDWVEMLYAKHLRRPVPEAVYTYLREHLPSTRGRHHNTSAVQNTSWEYMFSTTARDIERVDHQWESELLPWELHILAAECANRMPELPWFRKMRARRNNRSSHVQTL